MFEDLYALACGVRNHNVLYQPCTRIDRFDLWNGKRFNRGGDRGRNHYAAPGCSTHKMPSWQAGLEARPRLSLRRGSDNNGLINSHCSCVNSLCRFFMTGAQHRNPVRHKYLSRSRT